MSKLTSAIKHGLVEMLPPTLYFLVALHVVVIVRALMTHGAGITLGTAATVTVAALVLGKSVLVANMLPFINRFPEKPLVWNVAWKALIYNLVALAVHYAERLHEFWQEAPGLAAANDALLAHINWAHYWAVQLLVLMLVVNYCVIAEVARVVGRERMKAMFFGPMSQAGLPAAAK
ncbi:hypothetical protein BJN34_33920 [Cupriavidus necator]|uniref:Transmembrane protein n=1 Tax=Cupriavidus necator TaxID=106590 RepID=A0A1U9V250_CUPNE|nr:hypothetical protein [Cupriavidus necator]AQV98879.1 hypothetical protein BJN34_33920 [Cupriavidus necator]